MSSASDGPAEDGSAGVDWLRYIASAVIVFGIQPSEAWLLTPQLYWAIYDFKMEELNPKRKRKSPSDAPQTQTDITAMEDHLIKMGKL